MALFNNEIGNLGHLGNQMFQYASLQGIARNRRLDWRIPPKDSFGKSYPSLRSNIYDCFYLDTNIENHTGVGGTNDRIEKIHGFDADTFNNVADDSNLSGYYQSYKYFDHIKKKIKRDFTFRPTSIPPVKKENTVAIHVRRTDYLGLCSYHPNLADAYYLDALEVSQGFTGAIVFSDDIEWCKGLDIFKDFEFSTRGPYEDMHLMSLCGIHIIANSSFSWWGAYLSESNRVVAPRNWFGPALPENDPSGYYLPEWTII
jgi:hypothetical protein